jgi:hypothetical protein|tara:strand:+ start:1170 stop:1598 length:429 start_codon:yes stop_codon:yes gene_type:complete
MISPGFICYHGGTIYFEAYIDSRGYDPEKLFGIGKYNDYSQSWYGYTLTPPVIPEADMPETKLTPDQINCLHKIVTYDNGRHFLELWDDDILEILEDSGHLEVHRPVHDATGIPYGQEHWTVTVTESGYHVATTTTLGVDSK